MSDIKDMFKERYGNQDPEETLKSKILQFIKTKDKIQEYDFNDFAHQNGYEYSNVIYALGKLVKDLSSGVGKHVEILDTEYDQVQLVIGTNIELEHTDSKALAKEIAKDHLSEIEDYYTRLVKMEREAEEDPKLEK